MTTRDSHPPEQIQSKRLRFGHYVLDLDRGCLVRDGKEIALRPKTFAVLHYLVENPSRLVSKDELFSAVWPNLAVSDDALVQSIGELRRALADDGPRMIKTIPRRGYRFESDVSADGSIGQSFSANAGPVAPDGSEAIQSPQPVKRGRIVLFASLALTVLLAVGMFWSDAGRCLKFLNTFEYANPQIGAKPAVAILRPFSASRPFASAAAMSCCCTMSA
jgi:DNA-binding winged helix-turn-helix (wHTH) protein